MVTNVLCEKSVKKLYLSYVIPTLIAMASSSMYVLADVYFISIGAGSSGLAALNIALPMFTLYSAIGLTFGVGGATVISIAEGTKNDDLKNKAFTISIIGMLIVGIILAIAGTLFVEQLAYALGSSEALLVKVKAYMIPVNSCAFAFIIMYASSVLLRADHAPKLAMKATLIGNLSNIVLDYVFVIIFQMGLFGASLATTIAPFITILCILPHFLKKRNHVHFVREWMHKETSKRIFLAGIGSGILEVSAGLIIIIFNIVILKISNELFLAAYAIVTNIAYVCKGLLNGFAQAAQPIISVNYGAEKYGRVKEVMKVTLYSSIIFSIVLYIIFLLFPNSVASVFANHDMQLIKEAGIGIRYYFSSLVFMAAVTVLLYYYQSIECGKAAIILAVCKGFVLVIVGMVILLWQFGIQGIWWCVTFAEACALFMGYGFYKRMKIR